MKKIISCILSMAVIIGTFPVMAAESVNWRDTSYIKALLEQCSEKGINTCYEEVDFNILNRFVTYYAQDVENGVSQERLDYNNEYLSDLYTSVIDRLEGYLDGSRTPKSEPVTYMSGDYNIEGSNLINNNNEPFFSNGYGFFEEARNDIKNLNGFGAYNVQIEEGMKYYIEESDGIPYWRYSVNENMDASLEIDTTQGCLSGKSLKITNNTPKSSGVYMQIYQDVFVEPDTTYEYGFWVKGSNVNNVWLSATGWDNRQNISASSEWTKKSYTFTTGKDTYSTTIRFLCEGITNELWADGFYMKKSNGENVIQNSGFEEESDDFYEVYPCNPRSKSLVEYLAAAQENNISVCLNLAPHYFPEFMYELYPEIEGGYGLMRFNIDHPAVKEIISAYAKAIMGIVKDYPAVTGICLTNEPTFSTVRNTSYFNPGFREYLEERYGSIDNLNSKYNSVYASFEDINIPASYTQQPIFYDWMNYNEEFFSQWHEWFYDIIKQYDPDMPVYSKMMSGMTSNGSDIMERGSDYTLFALWGDMMGFDGGANIYDDSGRIKHLAVHDMMSSVSEKPLYNSENHLIPDGDNNYIVDHARHVYNQLWQCAVHGLDASTIWVWARSETEGDPLSGSILNRPDCLRAAAYAGMDLNRNMDIISAFQDKKRDVGIFYSEASNLYDTDYKDNMMSAYEALLYNGLRSGFVNEERMDLLSEYDTLIVPEAFYAEDASVDAIREFVLNGGSLIFIGEDCLSYDEFKSKRDISDIKSKAKIIDDYNLQSQFMDLFADKISYIPIDNDTGLVLEKISAERVICNGDEYINVCNYDSENSKAVKLQKDGRTAYYYNLTAELSNDEIIELDPLECVLLKVAGTNIIGNSEDIRLVSDWGNASAVISWKNPALDNIESIEVTDESGKSVVPPGTVLKTGASEINGFKIEGLTNDTLYSFIVKISAGGEAYEYKTSVIPRALGRTVTTDGYDISPWQINREKGFATYIDNEEKYSGSSSLKISGNCISDYFSMLQDKWYGTDVYEITFMAKAEGVDGAAQVLNRWDDPRITISSGEWEKYTLITHNETDPNPNPRIIVETGCEAVWIDDLEVRKYENGAAVGDNLNADSGFEFGVSGISAHSGNEKLTISWRNPENDYIQNITVSDGCGRAVSGTEEFDKESGAVNSITVNGLKNGECYKFNVVFILNGVKKTLSVEGTPTAEDKTKVTEDGFLLNNWSFISGGETISSWLDTEEYHFGKSSLKIISNYSGKYGQLTYSGIKLDKNKTYRLSFWAKTDNLLGKFECCNDWNDRIAVTGSEWKQYSMDISGQDIFYLRYIFEAPGVMWLDSVEFYEMNSDGRVGDNLISDGDFEESGVGTVSFSLNAEKLTAEAEIFNYTGDDLSVCVFLAVYNSNKRLLRVSKESVNADDGIVSVSSDFHSGENARLFFWKENGLNIFSTLTYDYN